MKQLEFTREDTRIIKGIAVILMFIHHLFAFPDRIHYDYISLTSISGRQIEFIIGVFGKICVGIFLFLSGFGMYKQYYKNENNIKEIIFNKLKNLYMNYLLIFIIFVPMGFLLFNRHFLLSEFIGNIVGYSSSYNKEWWFFIVYVLLIITFPLFVKIIKNNFICEILKIMFIATIVRTVMPAAVKGSVLLEFSKTVFYKELYLMLQWLPCFLMGVVFAKLKLFPRLKELFVANKLDNILVHMIIIIGTIYMRYKSKNVIYFDYLLAPVFIFSIINAIRMLRLNNVFFYIGKHSTNMWLVHSFFCYYYFQKLVFYPEVSVIITLWLIVLSIISSIFIEVIKESMKRIIGLVQIKNMELEKKYS